MTTHIWPFETGLDADHRVSLVLAEVYPSLVPPLALDGLPKDAGQVSAIAEHFAALDADDALALEASTQATLLGRPAQMEAARAVFEKRAPVFAPRRRS